MGQRSLVVIMGMREDIRIPLTMLSINYLNELPFIGSYKGKRFKFEKKIIKIEKNNDNDSKKDVNADITKLVVYVWKDMFNFENTDMKDIIIKEFEFTKAGIDEGLNLVEETNF